MANSLRPRLGSTSWCSAGALAIAAFGLVACGGDDSAHRDAEKDPSNAGTAGTGSAGSGAAGAPDDETGGTAGKGGTGSGATGGTSAGTGGGAGTAGKGGSAPQTECELDPVCHALSELGVDTEASARLDRDGEPLPESWNPLGGTRRALYPSMELFAGGMNAAGATNKASVLEFNSDDTAEAAREHKLMRDLSDAAWTQATVHAAVAADLDGDGIDEVAGIWLDGGELKLRVISDVDSGDNQGDVVLGSYAALGISVASGDFDGDGRDELAVAVLLRNTTEILFVDDKEALYDVSARQTISVPRANLGAKLGWKLAAGNLDNDAADELVGVANEVTDWNAGAATADYHVWDDLGAGSEELDGGPVIVRDGSTYTPRTAGVAIVDMDNDGLGEVVLAGITGYDANQGMLEYAMVTLDDAPNAFAPIAAKHFSAHVDQTDNRSAPSYTTVWVNGLDIDGDLVPEVQVNEYVFGNLSQPGAGTPGAWPQRYAISLADFQTQGGQDFRFDADNSAMAVGDMNGDHRDDIVYLAPDKRQIRVFGLVGTTPRWSRYLDVPVTGLTAESRTSPMLVATNVDRDTPVLELVKAESEFVFTEPVIIAAVAAPPCSEDIGQNTDACQTSFGHASSEDVTRENSVTLSASLTFGVSFEDRVFTQSQVELEATATLASTHTESQSYTVEKSVTFTTGAMEDAVVFTTIPYDRYVYTFLAHPDPTMVGETITVNVPREPITLMAERSFYNEHVVEGSPKVDAEIFQHSVGDIASYPSIADRNALQRLWGGIDNGPASTDQGGGEKTLDISVGRAYATGSELALGFEFAAKLTFGGVMAGFSVGAETSNALTVTSGSSTSYSGTVGAIDASHFASE